MGIELEELEKDRAVYMERILQYEEDVQDNQLRIQEYQSKTQEIQVAIIHNKGALAQVNTNIAALTERAKEKPPEEPDA